jgi:hypothetical protein
MRWRLTSPNMSVFTRMLTRQWFAYQSKTHPITYTTLSGKVSCTRGEVKRSLVLHGNPDVNTVAA